MKQIWTTLAVLLFLGSQTSWAQLQLRFSAGYNVGANSEPSGFKFNITQDSETEENIYNSLGAGFTVDLGLGYKFSEFISAELGIQYLAGANAVFADVYIEETPDNWQSSLAQASTQQLRLIPAIIMKAPMEGPLQPYGRFGLVLPVTGQTTSTVTSTETIMGNQVIAEEESQTTGEFSVGFLGAIGLGYAVNERLGLSLEAQYTGLRIAANEQELVRFDVTAGGNVTSQLDNLDTYDKQAVYVDELGPNSNNIGFNPDAVETEAREELRTTNNFNALGLQLGIWFNF